MSLSPASIDLILAVMDLKMVQSVVRAMRAADCAAAERRRCGLLGPAAVRDPQPGPKLHPAQRIEPRRVIHPAPRFQPRPVVHPQPRFDPPPAAPPAADERPRVHNFHLVPPWKILPWKNPPQPAIRVKLVKRRPDIHRTGALVDVVI